MFGNTQAFVEFVNRDVGKFKNADLMCSFCDRILKTGGEKLSDAEVRVFIVGKGIFVCLYCLGRVLSKLEELEIVLF